LEVKEAIESFERVVAFGRVCESLNIGEKIEDYSPLAVVVIENEMD